MEKTTDDDLQYVVVVDGVVLMVINLSEESLGLLHSPLLPLLLLQLLLNSSVEDHSSVLLDSLNDDLFQAVYKAAVPPLVHSTPLLDLLLSLSIFRDLHCHPLHHSHHRNSWRLAIHRTSTSSAVPPSLRDPSLTHSVLGLANGLASLSSGGGNTTIRKSRR